MPLSAMTSPVFDFKGAFFMAAKFSRCLLTVLAHVYNIITQLTEICHATKANRHLRSVWQFNCSRYTMP